MKGDYTRSVKLGVSDSHIMNVVDADKRSNSHVDIPYRIY